MIDFLIKGAVGIALLSMLIGLPALYILWSRSLLAEESSETDKDAPLIVAQPPLYLTRHEWYLLKVEWTISLLPSDNEIDEQVLSLCKGLSGLRTGVHQSHGDRFKQQLERLRADYASSLRSSDGNDQSKRRLGHLCGRASNWWLHFGRLENKITIETGIGYPSLHSKRLAQMPLPPHVKIVADSSTPSTSTKTATSRPAKPKKTAKRSPTTHPEVARLAPPQPPVVKQQTDIMQVKKPVQKPRANDRAETEHSLLERLVEAQQELETSELPSRELTKSLNALDRFKTRLPKMIEAALDQNKTEKEQTQAVQTLFDKITEIVESPVD